jgi:hypothetical protein
MVVFGNKSASASNKDPKPICAESRRYMASEKGRTVT